MAVGRGVVLLIDKRLEESHGRISEIGQKFDAMASRARVSKMADSAMRLRDLERFDKLTERAHATHLLVEEARGRLSTAEEKVKMVAAATAKVKGLTDRVALAEGAVGQKRLGALVGGVVAEQLASSWPEWLLLGAQTGLSLSLPPTAAMLLIRGAVGFARWRRRKRRRANQASAQGAIASPPVQKVRTLNDKYAGQLSTLYEFSGGRSKEQDATLGREYDRHLAEIEEGEDQTLAAAAKKIRDRVRRTFGRIHAESPVPNEPVLSS